MDKNLSAVIIAGFITLLGITYFIYIRQDGSVLLALSSILGGFIGYLFGKTSGKEVTSSESSSSESIK